MKKQLRIIVFTIGTTVAIGAAPANATLVSRLGGMAVYDTDLNITWLADANAGAGSVFDDGSNTIDGRMSWSNANAWAASLSAGGFTDWRLPIMDVNDDGIVIDCSTATASDCLDNEYGYHFYQNGIDTSNPGLFSQIQTNNYWSSTEAGTSAWLFDFTYNDGSQLTTSKNYNGYAWAVRTGDVAAIPLPGAIGLFGAGLFAMLSVVRRKSSA